MNDYLEWLIGQHQKAGVLVDTNILLLILVGSLNPELITRFKRTEIYTPEDFNLALQIIHRFDRAITMQAVVTEVSNLAGQLPQENRLDCFLVLRRWIEFFSEHHVATVDVARLVEFPRFGFTDAAILQGAANGYLVFTDDFRLSGYMEHFGLPVLNMNHARGQQWLL